MFTQKSKQKNQYKKEDKKEKHKDNLSFNTILLNDYFTIY